MATKAVFLKEETWVSRSYSRHASNGLNSSYMAETQQGHAGAQAFSIGVRGHLSKPGTPLLLPTHPLSTVK